MEKRELSHANGKNLHWYTHFEEIPHVQGQRRSHSKTIGGAESHLESNPIPTRDTWRTQTKPCAQQETPQRLSQT